MRESENIKAVAELKPDFMGFIFYPESPRFADDLLDPEVFPNLPSEISKTGVFVNAGFNKIMETVGKYSLDVVQLHGNETPELCCLLKKAGLRVMKTFNIRDTLSYSMYRDFISCTDYFLFDTMTSGYGGSGEKFDWKLLSSHDPSHPFFLSGGISPDDSDKITHINNSSFYGVDLNSRFEIRPGLKDIEKLRKFINELRIKSNQ